MPNAAGGKVLAGVMLSCVALCAVPFALPVSQTSGMAVAGASSYAPRRLFESPVENPFANFLLVIIIESVVNSNPFIDY